MKKIITSALLAYSITAFSQSQYTNVIVDSTHTTQEVTIQINPRNTDYLVGAANGASYFYSQNGGSNWTGAILSNSQWGVLGDPCVVIDTNQNFYYFHLSYLNGHGNDRIVCQKSTDFGLTWNNPGSYTYLNWPKTQDKEWAAVDLSGGPYGNWIYCTWTEFDQYGSILPTDSSRILFARSTDGSYTWTGVKQINKKGGDCYDGDYTVEGAVPTIGPNGEIYVAWAGPAGINNFKIFFDRSTDGGDTWLDNDIIAASQKGGWDLGPGYSYGVVGILRSNGLPVTCCDLSNGPHRGNIYINYIDSVAPHDRDVMVVKSTDGGNTWSTPVRINNDPPGNEQFFTWMAVDNVTGNIYTVFYDRRNYSDTRTDVYFAYSNDGGDTWVNERISASPFQSTITFLGDYIGITAHNGRVRPIWTRVVNGRFSAWTALIEIPIGLNNQNTEIPSSFALYQNYPNPFNPTTKFRFDVPKSGNSSTEHVQIKVYDLLGKEAAMIVNEDLAPGTYEYEWDASNLSSGVYFYTLKTNNFEATRKLVLNK